MIVYKVGKTKPIAVECENFGYPNVDADGETMYENSHFKTEDEAWQAVLSLSNAFIETDTRNVKEKRKMLTEAEQQLVNSAIRLSDTRKNWQEYLERTPSNKRLQAELRAVAHS